LVTDARPRFKRGVRLDQGSRGCQTQSRFKSGAGRSGRVPKRHCDRTSEGQWKNVSYTTGVSMRVSLRLNTFGCSRHRVASVQPGSGYRTPGRESGAAARNRRAGNTEQAVDGDADALFARCLHVPCATKQCSGLFYFLVNFGPVFVRWCKGWETVVGSVQQRGSDCVGSERRIGGAREKRQSRYRSRQRGGQGATRVGSVAQGRQ
jgi:hypothetical protein